MAASLLRHHFHDCIVNGCDGAVLLDDSNTFTGQKNAKPNRNSARGFELIDKVKADVEKACPSTVPCANILAVATAQALSIVGGPSYTFEPLENRDILSPSLENITRKFTSKGLDIKDMFVLSGAHAMVLLNAPHSRQGYLILMAPEVLIRTLTHHFLISNLQNVCPNQDSSDTNLAPPDSVTTNKFDNVYYKKSLNNSGLLRSNQALMKDNTTAAMVANYSKYPFLFFRDF